MQDCRGLRYSLLKSATFVSNSSGVIKSVSIISKMIAASTGRFIINNNARVNY